MPFQSDYKPSMEEEEKEAKIRKERHKTYAADFDRYTGDRAKSLVRKFLEFQTHHTLSQMTMPIGGTTEDLDVIRETVDEPYRKGCVTRQLDTHLIEEYGLPVTANNAKIVLGGELESWLENLGDDEREMRAEEEINAYNRQHDIDDIGMD